MDDISKRRLVIAISGVTNGGKTTLARRIKHTFPGSIVLSQDDYFLPVDSDKHVLIPKLNHLNWDILTAFDMNKMRADINEILSKKCDIYESPVLVLEGVLILNDINVADICDKKYFVTVPYEVCLERRTKRSYDPPDVPGYFEEVVWPQYIINKKEAIELNPDVEFIDGTLPCSYISEKIVSDIQQLLLNKNNCKCFTCKCTYK